MLNWADFFNNDSSGRDEVYNLDPNASEHHKAKISHEVSTVWHQHSC
jgi:hypothetical protein